MMQSREDYYSKEENPEAQLEICVYGESSNSKFETVHLEI